MNPPSKPVILTGATALFGRPGAEEPLCRLAFVGAAFLGGPI